MSRDARCGSPASTITPVAFADPPLLNAVGVHEPFALRAVVEVATDGGLVGLGESYADDHHLAALRAAADAVVGVDAYHTEEVYRRVAEVVGQGGHAIASGTVGSAPAADPVFSPFEVACLDIQGKAAGRPVVRPARRRGQGRGAVLGLPVLQVGRAPGPGAGRLRRGARPGRDRPAGPPPGRLLRVHRAEAEGRRLPAGAGGRGDPGAAGGLPFDHPLRLDPNAAWSPVTSIGVAQALDGVLEYLEDPTEGIGGMAEVAAHATMPLATNMCVIAFSQLPPAIAADAVQVVLADHHYWGGLRRARLLAGICQTFGLGVSMHSDPHLGISLAAMTHLAASTPNLGYACDTHYPWRHEDVIAGSPLPFSGGSIRVPCRARARGRARPGRARGPARAVPPLRRPRARRHRLHAHRRPLLPAHPPPLVGAWRGALLVWRGAPPAVIAHGTGAAGESILEIRPHIA